MEMNKNIDMDSYTKRKIEELRLKIQNNQTREKVETNKAKEFTGEHEKMEVALVESMQNSTDKNKCDVGLKEINSKTETLTNIEMSDDIDSYTKRKIEELRSKIETRKNVETKNVNEEGDLEERMQNNTDKTKIDDKPKKQQQNKNKIEEKLEEGQEDKNNIDQTWEGVNSELKQNKNKIEEEWDTQDTNKIDEILKETKPKTENFQSENLQKSDKIRNLEESLEKLKMENIEIKIEKKVKEDVLNDKVCKLKDKLEQMNLEMDKIQAETKETIDNLKNELGISKTNFETEQKSKLKLQQELDKVNSDLENLRLEKEKEISTLKDKINVEEKAKLKFRQKYDHKSSDLNNLQEKNRIAENDIITGINNYEAERQSKQKLEYDADIYNNQGDFALVYALFK